MIHCAPKTVSESDGEEIEIGSVRFVQTDEGMKAIHLAPKTVSEGEREEDEVGKVSLVRPGGITMAHAMRENENARRMAGTLDSEVHLIHIFIWIISNFEYVHNADGKRYGRFGGISHNLSSLSSVDVTPGASHLQ